MARGLFQPQERISGSSGWRTHIDKVSLAIARLKEHYEDREEYKNIFTGWRTESRDLMSEENYLKIKQLEAVRFPVTEHFGLDVFWVQLPEAGRDPIPSGGVLGWHERIRHNRAALDQIAVAVQHVRHEREAFAVLVERLVRRGSARGRERTVGLNVLAAVAVVLRMSGTGANKRSISLPCLMFCLHSPSVTTTGSTGG